MTKLFIFDMDGVLVDACEWHRLALNEALKEVSNYQIPLEEHYSTFNGIPTKVKLSLLEEKGIIKKEDKNRIENLKQEKTLEIISSFCEKRKEKIEMVTEIKNRGHKLACYTNSIRKTTELMLSKTGILNFFDLLVTNQDVNMPKPDPEGYNKIIKHFSIPKEKCFIIEDSPKGIEAAKKSGVNVVVVKNPDDVDINLLEKII